MENPEPLPEIADTVPGDLQNGEGIFRNGVGEQAGRDAEHGEAEPRFFREGKRDGSGNQGASWSLFWKKRDLPSSAKKGRISSCAGTIHFVRQ